MSRRLLKRRRLRPKKRKMKDRQVTQAETAFRMSRMQASLAKTPIQVGLAGITQAIQAQRLSLGTAAQIRPAKREMSILRGKARKPKRVM